MNIQQEVKKAVEEFKKKHRVEPVTDRYAVMVIDISMPDSFYEVLTKTLTTLAHTIATQVHEESIREVRKEIRQRIKVCDILLDELENGNAMDGDTIENQIAHETSVKAVMENLLETLSTTTKSN